MKILGAVLFALITSTGAAAQTETTYSGNRTDTGSNPNSGPGLFAGVSTLRHVNNVQVVDTANTQGWPGADIGAWINAAYAALPPNGGAIDVFCDSGSAAANFSTPVIFNTSNKYVKLRGRCTANSSGGGLTLNYTPTAASVAMTFDYTPAGGGGYTPGNGMSDIVLTNNGCVTNGGCGSSATGVQFGNTNGGAHAADFTNVRISGFGTGINFNDSVGWGVTLNNFWLAWNTVGGNYQQAQENIHWIGGACAVNGICWTTGAITPSDLYVDNVSIDSNTTAGMTGALYFTCAGCHMENLGTTTVNYVNLTMNSVFSMLGGDAVDDNTTGTVPQFFTLNLAVGYLHGVIVATGGQTVTSLFNLSGGTGAIAYGSYLTGSPSRVKAPCSINSACDFAVSTGFTATAPLHNWINSSVLQLLEGSCPSVFSGSDFLCGDSASHTIKASLNGAALATLNTVTQRFGASCTTAATAGAACTTTYTWTNPFPDANYTVSCIGSNPAGTPTLELSSTPVAATITVQVTAITAAGSSYGAVECVARHD